MTVVLLWASAVTFCCSALAVATKRENRWGVFAWWLNSVSVGVLLVTTGADLLGAILAISSTLSAAVYFLIADTFGNPRDTENDVGSRKFAPFVFPAIVSAALGFFVIQLFKRTAESGLGFVGAPPREESFFSEEAFLSTQLIVVVSFVATVGVGILNRNKKEGENG